jgi:Flp pilus assembly protein TadD
MAPAHGPARGCAGAVAFLLRRPGRDRAAARQGPRRAAIALLALLAACADAPEELGEVEGTPAERIARYEQIQRTEPQNTEVLSRLAEALVEAGDTRAAAGRLMQAVQIEPDDPVLYQQLGTVYAALGERTPAIAAFEKVLELMASPDVHVILGDLLVDEGRSKDGIAHYEQALVLAPDDVDAHYNLGVALGKAERWADAERHYRDVLRVDGAHAAAANNLGAALLAQDKRGEAVQYFQRAGLLDPADALSRRNLALALYGEGRIEDALRVLQDGIAQDAENGMLLNLLAWFRATTRDATWRDGTEAVQLAERATTIASDDPSFFDTLAAAYAAVGRFDDAVRTEEKAIALAAGRQNLIGEFRPRLALYKDGKPYRDG